MRAFFNFLYGATERIRTADLLITNSRQGYVKSHKTAVMRGFIGVDNPLFIAIV